MLQSENKSLFKEIEVRRQKEALQLQLIQNNDSIVILKYELMTKNYLGIIKEERKAGRVKALKTFGFGSLGGIILGFLIAR